MTTMEYIGWSDIVKQYFGRCSSRNVFDIVCNIWSVDTGIKSAYLWDRLATKAETVMKFIEYLIDNHHLKHKLIVLDIEECIFIVKNIHLPKNNISMVDVSYTLDVPNVIPEVPTEDIIKPILSLLDASLNSGNLSSFGNLRKIDPGENVNRTTLYGLLIGYPIVYWYSDIKLASNCLSMEPLCVQNVECRLKSNANKSFLLYSFSYPKRLHEKLKVVTDIWFKNLRDNAANNDYFENLTIDSKFVTLHSVAL